MESVKQSSMTLPITCPTKRLSTMPCTPFMCVRNWNDPCKPPGKARSSHRKKWRNAF